MEVIKHPFAPPLTWWLLLFSAVINHPSSARILGESPPPPPLHHHHRHHHTTFYMRDILNQTHPSPRPSSTTKFNNNPLPFSKPLGLFPPNGGIPLPNSPQTPTVQTLNFPGFSFPPTVALQELELREVVEIVEDLFGSTFGTKLMGKARGMCVFGSEDGTSRMMALTLCFFQKGDEIRLFGVHQADALETQIAVIGGTGRYKNANGYAILKTVNTSSSMGSYKLLSLSVYLN